LGPFVGHWLLDEVAVRAFRLADVEALEASAAQQTRPPSGAPGEKVGDDRRRRYCDCPDLQAGASRWETVARYPPSIAARRSSSHQLLCLVALRPASFVRKDADVLHVQLERAVTPSATTNPRHLLTSHVTRSSSAPHERAPKGRSDPRQWRPRGDGRDVETLCGVEGPLRLSARVPTECATDDPAPCEAG
jgi:hypothetical protein